jgi:hypothetical protein
VHLKCLSDLQKQLAVALPPHGSIVDIPISCTDSCLCHQVPGHAAALQDAAAAHAPLDVELLLEIITVLGSLGADLIMGEHTGTAQHAVIQALHRCALSVCVEQNGKGSQMLFAQYCQAAPVLRCSAQGSGCGFADKRS